MESDVSGDERRSRVEDVMEEVGTIFIRKINPVIPVKRVLTLFVIVTSLVLKNGNMYKLDLPVWSTEFHREL